MPRNKDLKRLIRARMDKTGESYTAARAQILKDQTPSPAELAERAGMANESVQAKTGKTWAQWLEQLDAADAISMSHRDIAKYVQANTEISGWWAQTVTVGYERIRGLREIGQRRGGSFDANKSKTFAVPISRLYKAFSTKRIRTRWLGDTEPTVRTSSVDKSMRMTWPDGTSVHAYFQSKGEAKSTVAIQHVGLPNKKAIADAKAYWAERFGELAVAGWGSSATFGDAVSRLVLPALVLASFTVGVLLRFTRAAVLEVLGDEYVRAARAKGLSELTVVRRHVLRPALLSVVTVTGVAFAGLLSGTVLVEQIFGWRGLGAYAYTSALALDLPAIMGVSVVVAVIYILINLVVDLLYGVIDPRLRLS